MHASQCSKQHYLQLPRYGSNLSVHQKLIDKEDVVCVCVCVCVYTHICIYIQVIAIKNNKILPFAATWMELERYYAKWNKSDRESKYCMISLICGI